VLVGVLALPGVASALTVDDDNVQCPTAAFTTIQSAVDAAAPGATIEVCRGTYPESVTIGAGKDDLSLVSTTTAAALVNGAEPFTIEADVEGVSIQKFRIESAAEDGAGILVLGAADLIRNNLIIGGQAGIDTIGGDALAGVSQGDVGAIRDNTLLGQDQAGVRVINHVLFSEPSGPEVNVLNNTVTGTASSSGIVYGGVGGAPSGMVFGNTISKAGLLGIEMVGLVDTTVKANIVFQNGGGLLVNAHLPVRIENNRINNNTGNGIEIRRGGSTLLSNNAKSNGGTDCVDTTSGSGTAGTANTWTGNYGLDWNVAGICKP
jgi:parallel beta-helix repeat protein